MQKQKIAKQNKMDIILILQVKKVKIILAVFLFFNCYKNKLLVTAL